MPSLAPSCAFLFNNTDPANPAYLRQCLPIYWARFAALLCSFILFPSGAELAQLMLCLLASGETREKPKT
jgi:hypothetical protein